MHLRCGATLSFWTPFDQYGVSTIVMSAERQVQKYTTERKKNRLQRERDVAGDLAFRCPYI